MTFICVNRSFYYNIRRFLAIIITFVCINCSFYQHLYVSIVVYIAIEVVLGNANDFYLCKSQFLLKEWQDNNEIVVINLTTIEQMSDLLSESFNNTPSENTHMCTLTLFIGYDSWTDIIAVCTMMLCNTSYQH